jgi:hypothetical protein
MMFGHNVTVIMTKTNIPEYLPNSPLVLPCPFCHAKPNQICEPVSGGRFELVHVARVKAAAKLDEARKNRKR